MKKLLLAILVTLCLASTAFTQGNIIFIKKLGCNPATNEVGDRDGDYSGAGYNLSSNDMICLEYTAECTGGLRYAYAYHFNTDADDQCKVCVYSSDGDAPDVGDELLGCSGAILGGGSAGWKTDSSNLDGTVTSGLNYWVCIVAGANSFYVARTTSGSRTLYLNDTSSYDSPPATLTGTWGDTASRDVNIYVEIE